MGEVGHFVKDRRHLDRKTVGNHLTLLIAMLNQRKLYARSYEHPDYVFHKLWGLVTDRAARR